jgi:MFS family permease
VIGGLLASANWRWIFAINLPIGVISSCLIFLLIRKIVKPAQPPRPRPHIPTKAVPEDHSAFGAKLLRIDWYGAALFIAGGILVLLALHWGSTDRWSEAQVIACFVVGGVVLIAFAGWEWLMELFEEGKKTPPNPLAWTEAMIPLSIFKNYDTCATAFISLTWYGNMCIAVITTKLIYL